MLNYSDHYLTDKSFIDVTSLIRTLKTLKKVSYTETYDITNTICQTFSLKENVMNYYNEYGIYKEPIVVTDDDYCLDGRHRIAFLKESNIMICPAYVVPREYINKFIKNY